MAYRKDKDLEFFSKCTDDELKNLFDCLVYDKDGEKRIAEMLTISEEYKKWGENYSKYWENIAGEFQGFGGNTIANIFRLGDGVTYQEILKDVASEMKVKYSKEEPVEEIENKLILKIFNDSWNKMSLDEQKKLVEELGISKADLAGQGVLGATQIAMKLGGFQTYKLTLIVVNAVSKALLGRGLTLAGNAALMKSISVFTGPIGWVVTALWTIFDIASPAKRVTIPAVFDIILMRKTVEYRLTPKECFPMSIKTSLGESVDNNIEIMKQYGFLGLEETSTLNEIEGRYRVAKSRYKSFKGETAEDQMIADEKYKEITRAHEILKKYLTEIHEIFDTTKILVECPNCEKKLRIALEKKTYECPKCKTRIYLSEKTITENIEGLKRIK